MTRYSMRASMRSCSAASAIAVALTGLTAFGSTAVAQDAGAVAEAVSFGDIVVTARRVEERLQDVPATVAVFTADAIEKAGINKAEDFINLTPGVTIVTSTAEAGDTQINIRGINGARDAESSVALVVDGILKTNTAALNQDQGTLQQIEVLKGPQGAIYGRNAAAGAMVLTTKKPGDVLEAQIKGSVANNSTHRLSGFISAPLTEAVGVVVSGDFAQTDGFFRNAFLGNRKVVDDQDSFNLNGRIVAQVSERTDLDFKVRYGELDGASINFNAAFHLPNFAGVDPAFYEDVNTHPFLYYGNIRPRNTQQTFETSVKIDHELDFATLTAWVAYSDIKNNLTADGTSADFARYTFDATGTDAAAAASAACFASTAELTGFPLVAPTFIGTSPVPFIFDPANGSTFGPYSPATCDGTQYQERNQKDISAEIRLSSLPGGPFNWQLGGYYLNIDREVGVSLGADLGLGVIESLYNGPDTSNPTSQLYWDNFTTDVFALFGSVDGEVTDGLTASLALRYDIEKRNVRSLVPEVFDPITGGTINPGQTVVGGAVRGVDPQGETFKQLQPKVSLSYAVTPQVNVYANWGIGFKSGGFNNQGSNAIVESAFNDFIGSGLLIEDQFRKEKSSAFEVGMKGSAFDGVVNFDFAGFYTSVTDMQFFEFLVGGFGLLRVVSNIDKVDIYGAEANMNVRVMRGWNIFGSANITDSEIKDNASRPYTVGNKSPHTADYTINVGTQIDQPVTDNINAIFRADWRLTGPTWFHTVQGDTVPTLFSGLLPGSALALPGFVGDANFDVSQRDSFSVVNARIGLEGDNWGASLFADNLFNEKYVAEVISAAEFGGSFISPGSRRTYGVELFFRF